MLLLVLILAWACRTGKQECEKTEQVVEEREGLNITIGEYVGWADAATKTH